MASPKDIVFGLGLNSRKFDDGMKKAGAELRKLASTRLDALRKEMAGLTSSTDALSKKKLRFEATAHRSASRMPS